jgi:hypothetical protein
MLTIQVTRASSSEAAIAVLVIAVSLLIRALTRLVLCGLAAHATREALKDPASGQPDAAAVRAHRLAVLQAILAALMPRGGWWRPKRKRKNKRRRI